MKYWTLNKGRNEYTIRQTSVSNVLPSVWRKLWGQPIHPKVKLFMWKCFNNAVATNLALVARNIITDLVCLRYGKAEESITHMFRCEPTIKVWTLPPFRLRPEELQECRHMMDWWECLQERIAQNHLPSSSMGLGFLYCWWIWHAKNDFTFNSKTWAIEAVCGKAQSDFYEFLDANTKISSPPTRRDQCETLAWQRPSGNQIKINVDAAVSRNTKTIRTGALARGEDGKVMGISLNIHPKVTLTRVTEALAIRDGLKLGMALNLSRVSIESNLEAIVKSCLVSNDPHSDIAVLTHDCSALKKLFISCDFTFVKRECNRAAHTCAQKALSNDLSGL